MEQLSAMVDECSRKNGTCDLCFNQKRCDEIWDTIVSPAASKGQLAGRFGDIRELLMLDLINHPDCPNTRLRYICEKFKEDGGFNGK